jgi:hypothetical protein
MERLLQNDVRLMGVLIDADNSSARNGTALHLSELGFSLIAVSLVVDWFEAFGSIHTCANNRKVCHVPPAYPIELGSDRYNDSLA